LLKGKNNREYTIKKKKRKATITREEAEELLAGAGLSG